MQNLLSFSYSLYNSFYFYSRFQTFAKMTKEENEHPLFEVIKNSKPETIIEDVRNFFEIDGVSIEILDGSGMTPLMHACWKGNVSFAKFLIDQVNIKKLHTLLFQIFRF